MKKPILYTPPTCSRCKEPARPIAYAYQKKHLCESCWDSVLKSEGKKKGDKKT